MAIVFIPSLVALLEAKEKEAGYELTKNEVEFICDNATAIELPAEIENDMTKSRGYPDLYAGDIWNEWSTYKKSKNL